MKHSIDYNQGSMRIEDLGGKSYEMRLTHRALAELEGDFGETTLETANRLLNRLRVSHRHIALIIARSSGKTEETDVERISEAVVEEGLITLVPIVADYFAMTLRGFRPPPKEKKSARPRKRRTRSGD